MRIDNSGNYEACRWMKKPQLPNWLSQNNISSIAPLTYFKSGMSQLRQDLLSGQDLSMCEDCKIMEQHHKVSGRQRQLLKVGVFEDHFEKSLASSPMRSSFDYSFQNQGQTNRTVSDWQIDLGNYCNGACVFCNPKYSSTLAIEFKKLGLIDSVPPPAWCDDPVLLDRFVSDLIKCKDVRYLHFIGGETLITPGFKKILEALIFNNLATQISIGFTTNLSTWSDPVVELLKQFKEIDLGLSIETLTPLNDYVRYPAQHNKTLSILNKWVELGHNQKWLIQLRPTPTCLTVHELDTVYEYAWNNNLAVESCNFLSKPEYLKISVLPDKYRKLASERLKKWIAAHNQNEHLQILNTRDPHIVKAQIIQDAQSYTNYLDSVEDESQRFSTLIEYLKLLEKNRGNCILDYLPQYEELFRSAGY